MNMASSVKTLNRLSKEELIDRVRDLQDENDDVRDTIDGLSERLESICDLASGNGSEEESDEGGDD
jgi:hypothetical protein